MSTPVDTIHVYVVDSPVINTLFCYIPYGSEVLNWIPKEQYFTVDLGYSIVTCITDETLMFALRRIRAYAEE